MNPLTSFKGRYTLDQHGRLTLIEFRKDGVLLCSTSQPMNDRAAQAAAPDNARVRTLSYS